MDKHEVDQKKAKNLQQFFQIGVRIPIDLNIFVRYLLSGSVNKLS